VPDNAEIGNLAVVIVHLRAGGEENIVFGDAHVPCQPRHLEDAGIEIDQRTAPEQREQRLLRGAAEIPEDVGIAHDPPEALLGRIEHRERLRVVVRRARVVQQHDRGGREAELRKSSKRRAHSPPVLIRIPRGREQVQPVDLVTELPQSEQVLETVPPIPASLDVFAERSRQHDASFCSPCGHAHHERSRP
jgi:hypothetical protein